MNRFKGTPAPWHIDNEHKLADENYHFILSGDGFHCKEENKGFNIACFMSKYDAHLIAAAPELLEVLIEIRKLVLYHDKADLVIQKALGEVK